MIVFAFRALVNCNGSVSLRLDILRRMSSGNFQLGILRSLSRTVSQQFTW
jgi:hypothetical protein